jgi:hypothetical protein
MARKERPKGSSAIIPTAVDGIANRANMAGRPH